MAIITAIRTYLEDVKRWEGWMFIITSAWFIILAVFAYFLARIFPMRASDSQDRDFYFERFDIPIEI